jgi:hypothetical protein
VCNSGDIGDEFHYIYIYIVCDVLFNLSNLYNIVIIYKIKEKSWKEFTEFSGYLSACIDQQWGSFKKFLTTKVAVVP